MKNNEEIEKKRICIIRRAYYPAESHTRRNAETLAEAGYDVQLLCLRNKGECKAETISGVEVHRLPLRAKRSSLLFYLVEYAVFFFMAFISLSVNELKHHYDVIEVESMPNFLIFTAFIPRLRGTRLILYLFESMPELWMQKMRWKQPNLAVRLLQMEEKISCLFAHELICCHNLAKEALISRKIPKSKITVILNVPDEKVFIYKKRLPNKLGVLKLIQHGTITENYGIQVVLNALVTLEPEYLVHYDIVGEGEYRPVLEQMVVEAKLAERVTFHGFVNRGRLLDLLNHADVGIVPMLFEYQSPNKLFEFVALGLPIIASDRTTFLQYFSTEEILYFQTNDSQVLQKTIKEIYNKRSLLHDNSIRALQKFSNYRWNIMKLDYLRLYKKQIQQVNE